MSRSLNTPDTRRICDGTRRFFVSTLIVIGILLVSLHDGQFVVAQQGPSSATNQPPPTEREDYNERVMAAAYTLELAAITARYKADLLDILELDAWRPVQYNGFEDYEPFTGKLYVIGYVPDHERRAALESVTVIPSIDESVKRHRRVFLTIRTIVYDYLGYALVGHPEALEMAVITCSHFTDLVLCAPILDHPFHFSPGLLDHVYEAVLSRQFGYVQKLSDAKVQGLREAHKAFRAEVESVRLDYGQERPVLTDNVVETVSHHVEVDRRSRR